jgi:Dolichyl-phosphate-mannose-protein mannosyltransferase
MTRSRRGLAVLGLATLCFAVYFANFRGLGSFDSLSTSSLPFALLRGDGFNLDRYAIADRTFGYSFVRSRTDHWVSMSPVMTALVAAPFYAPLALFPAWAEAPWRFWILRSLMEKISAAGIAAASAAILYLVLRRLTGRPDALLLSLAYAFATPTWTISGQALWQHGTTNLLVALALWFLLENDDSPRRGLALGAIAGAITANRPMDIAFSLAIAIAVISQPGRGRRAFLFAAGLAAAFLLAYNIYFFGNVIGGYGVLTARYGAAAMFSRNWPGIAGILVSNRGILVFCPFLILLIALRLADLRTWPGIGMMLAAYAVTLAFHGSFHWWDGGSNYGPRYATDGLPILIAALAGPLARLRTRGRVMFAAAVVWGFAL